MSNRTSCSEVGLESLRGYEDPFLRGLVLALDDGDGVAVGRARTESGECRGRVMV